MNVHKNYNLENSANFDTHLQGGNDMRDSAGSQLNEHTIQILSANEGDEGALRLSTVGTEKFLCPDCSAEVLVLEEKVVEFRQGQGLEVDIEDIYVLVQVEHQVTDNEDLLLLST